MDKYIKLIDICEANDCFNEKHDCDNCVFNKIPATDIQPVKRGEWELTNNPSFRKCSECGAWWSSDITDNCFTNYCPKCGTRMIKDGDTNG